MSETALRTALEEALRAINSMKVEAETAGAGGDEQMLQEACEVISNEGLAASMAIDAALALAAPAQAAPANEALKNAALPWPWKTDAEVLDDAISAIEGQNRLKAALRSIAARTTPAASPAQAGEYPELPEHDAITVGLGLAWTSHSMRAYADATCTARGADESKLTSRTF